MKKVLLFTAIIFISTACFSQDLISLRRGERIEAIVTEVTPTLVRYKLFSNPEGKVYFVYKADVSGIMYKNGRVETFNQPDEQPIENQDQQNNSSTLNRANVETPNQPINYSTQTGDYIRFKNGTSRMVTVLEITPTLVKFRNYDNPTGAIYSVNKSDVYNIRYANGTVTKFDTSVNSVLGNQYKGEYASHFSQFHAGVTFPSGSGLLDFGDNAATGFTIGYKYYGSASVQNLYWVFGIEAFYNELNSDSKDALEYNDPNYDITFPKFLNFPATFGLNYSIPLSETAKIYGEGAMGLNLSMMTNTVVTFSNNEATTKITPAFGFSYGLEGGFFFNQKFSIGVRYNNLGSYKYKYKNYENGTLNESGRGNKLSISCTSLCVGVLF